MIYLEVKLLDDSLDKSTADIVPHRYGNGIAYVVYSENEKMKTHLESILRQVAYVPAPGKNASNFFADSALELYPNSIYHTQVIPELLSWRGYDAVVKEGAHKSFDFAEFTDFDLDNYFIEFVNNDDTDVDSVDNSYSVKSYNFDELITINDVYVDEFFGLNVMKSSEGIETNSEGERVVKTVPAGFVAYNTTSGKVVAGGRYLNANIDKEGAEWILMQNPYDGQDPSRIERMRKLIDRGIVPYHPAIEESAYQDGGGTIDPAKFNHDAHLEPSGQKPKTIAEFYPRAVSKPVKPSKTSPASTPSVSSSADDSLGGYPASLEPGFVVYSPESGLAFDSELWPPKDVDLSSGSWYMFKRVELKEQMKKFMWTNNKSPVYITGTSEGVVSSSPGLKVKEGVKISRQRPRGMTAIKPQSVVDIEINEDGPYATLIAENPRLAIIDTPEQKAKREEVARELGKIKSLVTVAISPELRDMEIPYLDADSTDPGNLGVASFRRSFDRAPKVGPDGRFVINSKTGGLATETSDRYLHQKAVVAALTYMGQYEAFGGPIGNHGHFVNMEMGLGKTAAVLAATVVLRNRGDVKQGSQTTLITLPNKNSSVWREEIASFTGESGREVVVVEGSREQRVEKWEELLDRAQKGTLPAYVIVGSSKFRVSHKESSDEDSGQDSEEEEELGMDAKYMALLSTGGVSSTSGKQKKIKGGHIGVMIMDEAGQTVNPTTNSNRVARQIVDSVYKGKGIVWTLDGMVSNNSAQDTVSQLGFVNALVRDNMDAIIGKYTKPDTISADGSGKAATRRIWDGFGSLMDFVDTFGDQIFHLSKRLSGLSNNVTEHEDEVVPLGPEWGSVYGETIDKLAAIQGAPPSEKSNAANISMGLITMLYNISHGVLNPARMLEYGVGMSTLRSSLEEALSSDPRKDQILDDLFFDTDSPNSYNLGGRPAPARDGYLIQFQKQFTDNIAGIGRIPKRIADDQDRTMETRNSDYEDTVPEEYRELISRVMENEWYDPYTEGIVGQVKEFFRQKTKGSNRSRVGIASMSRASIEKIQRRLSREMDSSSYLVQAITGSTSAEDVYRITQEHAKNPRNIITLITSAGATGLSLPADKVFRGATWSPGKGNQMAARFIRSVDQAAETTVVVPAGLARLVRKIEKSKKDIADATSVALARRYVTEGAGGDDAGGFYVFRDRIKERNDEAMRKRGREVKDTYYPDDLVEHDFFPKGDTLSNDDDVFRAREGIVKQLIESGLHDPVIVENPNKRKTAPKKGKRT